MRSSLYLAIASLLVACQEDITEAPMEPAVALSTTGSPTQMFNERIPIAFTAVGPCTNELIDVAGSLHVVSTVWNDPFGYRIRSHVNSNLGGVGQVSGLRYRVQQVANTNAEFDWVSGVFESDEVYRYHVISANSAPNFQMTLNVTFRFDPATGAEFVPKKWETVCR